MTHRYKWCSTTFSEWCLDFNLYFAAPTSLLEMFFLACVFGKATVDASHHTVLGCSVLQKANPSQFFQVPWSSILRKIVLSRRTGVSWDPHKSQGRGFPVDDTASLSILIITHLHLVYPDMLKTMQLFLEPWTTFRFILNAPVMNAYCLMCNPSHSARKTRPSCCSDFPHQWDMVYILHESSGFNY